MARRNVLRQLRCGMLGIIVVAAGITPAVRGDDLPFQVSVEVYRHVKDDVTAFQIRLEQPFLAGEFEKSNYLRLRASDERAYLIYPKETRFEQKHAEFYGRLRGEGKVELTLTYETISENLDGSKRVLVREGTIDINIPAVPAGAEEVGPRNIYTNWARKQNEYFVHMLEYYPHESFFQYCLLQSQARYGVAPPRIPQLAVNRSAVEVDLYEFMTPSLSIQAPLQRQILQGGEAGPPELVRHVSSLAPPNVVSLPYVDLLQKKLEQNVQPHVHDMARLVPADQYFLQFNTARSLGKAMDLAVNFGTSIIRLYTVEAQDYRLQSKFEQQLCIDRPALEKLAESGVVGDIALTGADPFVLEGTDVTLILRVKDKEAFQKEADAWLAAAKAKRADLGEQTFNYQGHQVAARYTNDRVISSFVVQHEGFVVYSNSHVAIRRLIDTAVSPEISLAAAVDYQYTSTILPFLGDDESGYFYASDAFVRRLIGPAAKISQKRRLECFNNLVMINNASLMYRLEYGQSPPSLSELVEGRFVDMEKIHCPHGGAYAFDKASDTCTCSLHNRLRYLTPNVELTVLNISQQEAAEYDRYKQRYEVFWQKTFNPLATRISTGERVKMEACILPQANGTLYSSLRQLVARDPAVLDTTRIAPSAIASVVLNTGREATAEYLKLVPGINEVIQEDPTLTDLSWVGDRISLHYCDGETILQVDPTQLQPLSLPVIGQASTWQQAVAGALAMSANMPVYVTVDVTDREKAERLLKNFWQRIFLKGGEILGLPGQLDAYQLPDYEGHAIYVMSARIYVLALRMHVALVNDQLVLATKPEILKEVIDQRNAQPAEPPQAAHLLVRFTHRALDQLRDDVALYWAEKSRLACHRNIVSIYNFHQLYGAPIDDVPQLSEAKYGIRYFCPEGGVYSYDEEHNHVVCSVHGNREHSRQAPAPQQSSFEKFAADFAEMLGTFRFEPDALITTLEIEGDTP